MNRILAAAAAAAALAAVSLAAVRPPGRAPTPEVPVAPAGRWAEAPGNAGWWVQRPPARWMRGEGTALVVFAAPGETAALCGDPDALACAAQVEGVPVIVMPDPCAGFGDDRFGQLACHETSHAFGGWKHEVA